MNPLKKFEQWFDEAKAHPQILHPTAMCLSTVDQDGVVRGRMMDLRCLDLGKFVFSTHLTSQKAKDIAESANVSLTFWWDVLKKQIRIQGIASMVSEKKDDEYFGMLPRRGQVLAHVLTQGAELLDENVLHEQIGEKEQEFGSQIVTRPKSWRSYAVVPSEFEFMLLKADRLHCRERFERQADNWVAKRLHP